MKNMRIPGGGVGGDPFYAQISYIHNTPIPTAIGHS